MIKAIPTEYRGVMFRSRLEAKWAAFFDNLNWPWKYEPIDLDGYIPDFILPLNQPVVVEVKPELYLKDLKSHTQKLEASGWSKEVIIVGANIFEDESLGLMRDDCCWSTCHLFHCDGCDKPSFHHEDNSYRCRVSGCYDGNAHLIYQPQEYWDRIFADASRKVQYKQTS